LSADAAGTIAAPISLPSVTAAAFPRSLTPMVDFDFAAKSYAKYGVAVAFDDIFTYTRASSATFTNRRLKKNGGYEYFLDNDFVGSVTNSITYSEDLTHSSWGKSLVSVLNGLPVAVAGLSNTCDKILENNTSGIHRVSKMIDVVAGNSYTFSGYFKAAERTVVALNANSAFNARGSVDLVSGAAVVNAGGVSSEYIGDGWYRVICTGVATTTQSIDIFMQVNKLNTGTDESYQGDGTSGIYIWGAQLTASAKPLPYVKTLDVAVTKTFAETLRTEYDPVTGENLGALIEGASTNTMTYSEEISAWYPYNGGALQTLNITDNYGLAPDNTMSASRLRGSLVDTTSTSRIIILRPSVTGSNITLSFWVKSLNGNYDAQFHFKGVALGTVSMTSEWKRVSISGVTVNATENFGIDLQGSFVSSLDFDFLMWGAQVENKEFASSYIRTEGAAVTRSSDNLNIDGNSSIPDGGQDLTVSIDVSMNDAYNHPHYAKLFRLDGQDLYMQSFAKGINNWQAVTNGVPLTFAPDISSGVTHSFATTYTSSKIAAYFNSVETNATTSFTPTFYNRNTTLSLGCSLTYQHIDGHISKFKTYAQALTAQEISLL
jgi:hypothetical protein